MLKLNARIGVCLVASLIGLNAYAEGSDDSIVPAPTAIQSDQSDEVSRLRVRADGDETDAQPQLIRHLASDCADSCDESDCEVSAS